MRIFLMLFFILSLYQINAQKIKNLPGPFHSPISFDDQASRDKFAYESGPGKKGELWLVMCDRDSLELFDNPSGNTNGTILRFKETAYVINESGQWIQIATGRRDENKFKEVVKTGWVEKSKILLWPKSLRDRSSGITKKGFLLNKKEEIDRILKNEEYRLVKIYDGPDSKKSIGNRGIYNVYFIFKEENNRLLLGGTDYIHAASARENIIGWVDAGRVEKWNQRLTLECNWDEDNYDKRKSSPNYRVYGFQNQLRADLYAKTGELKEVLWENDPASPDFSKSLRSPENRNRPIGEVFRFPVFTKTSGFIESGAINNIPTKKVGQDITGEISEQQLVRIRNLFDKTVAPKSKNWNVVFMIEASSKMANYKSAIISSVESLEKVLPEYVNVKYGAAIFRDANLSDVGQAFSIEKLTKDKKNIINFINEAVFNDFTDPDNYTNQRYALSQVVEKAGFSTDHNNLIIIIGACADFYFDFGRNETAASNGQSKYLIEDTGGGLDKIYDEFSQYDISLAYLQVENSAGKAYSKYSEDARGIMITIAQQQYARYKDVSETQKDANIKFPEMPDLEEGNISTLQNGIGYGIIKRPDRNSNFSQIEIVNFVQETMKKSYSRYEEFYKVVKSLCDGAGIKANNINDTYSPLIWDFMDKLDSETQKKVLDEKIKLYSKLYLPLKTIDNPNPYKYVVFMPQAELEDYIENIKQLDRVMNSPSNILRVQLYNTCVTLLQKLTGDRLSMKEVDKKGLDDLRKLMAGIEGEGFDIKDKLNISIVDIQDKKKFSDENLQKLTKTISLKLNELTAISRKGKDYPFAYSVGDAVYYWLDLDLLF